MQCFLFLRPKRNLKENENLSNKIYKLNEIQIYKHKLINLSSPSFRIKTQINLLMLDLQGNQRVRLINLLMPHANQLLYTPLTRQIQRKMVPLKRSLSILSNLCESATVKQPRIQLTKTDFQKINRSYQSLKRFKKVYSEHSIIQQDKKQDPQYVHLVELRKQMLKKKAFRAQGYEKHSQTARNLSDKNFTFLGLTQPVMDKYEKNVKNPQQGRYFFADISSKNHTTFNKEKQRKPLRK